MNKIEITYTDAYMTSGGFSFSGDITDTFTLNTLLDMKAMVMRELAVQASSAADGHPFILSFGEWQYEVVSEYPKITKCWREAVVYVVLPEGRQPFTHI